MQKPGYYILKFFLRLLGAMSLKAHYRCARFLAFLAGSVIKYRREVVAINLARSFPDLKYDELKALTKEFYRHFADLIVETVWFGACSEKRLREANVAEIVNIEEMNRLFELSPSIVTMYSHCGNWELYGGVASYCPADKPSCFREDNFVVVYRKLSSKVWDILMQENRKAPLVDPAGFEGLVESDNVVRYIMRHKGEKKIYNFNTDQSPYGNSSANIFVDFLHQDTRTMTAAAALAHKFGFSVAYQNMRPQSRGHYLIEYTTICEDASKMSVEDIMQRYYELLQKDIEAMPSNYLWTHKRWKDVRN